MPKWVKKICQTQNKPSKVCLRILKICLSGEISPNLVTPFNLRQRSSPSWGLLQIDVNEEKWQNQFKTNEWKTNSKVNQTVLLCNDQFQGIESTTVPMPDEFADTLSVSTLIRRH